MTIAGVKAAAAAMPLRRRAAPKIESKLTICEVCGEIFDATCENEVRHHASPAHTPLLPGRHG